MVVEVWWIFLVFNEDLEFFGCFGGKFLSFIWFNKLGGLSFLFGVGW